MANKVIISREDQEVFKNDSEWKEYAVKQVDVNESILKIIYDIEDVDNILNYFYNQYNYDKTKKNLYCYTNKDINGLKEFMHYLDYDINSPQILE